MTSLHSTLANTDINIILSEKVFYKKYPYRIKWLAAESNWNARYRNNIPAEIAVYKRLGLPRQPSQVSDVLEKQKSLFTSVPKILNQSDSKNLTAYFENEEDFLTAQTIYSSAILNVTVPALNNLAEIQDGLGRAEEIRKGLYWKKYRHKIQLIYTSTFQENDLISLVNKLDEMPGVFTSSGLRRAYNRERHQYRSVFNRHFWENMSIGFEHEADAAFISLVYGDHVESWKTAVLLEEIS